MALKGKSDNGNQLYLHYKYDSSTLSFSNKIKIFKFTIKLLIRNKKVYNK